MIDPNAPDHENAAEAAHSVDYYDEAYDDLGSDPLQEKPEDKPLLERAKQAIDSNPAAKLGVVVVAIAVLAGGAFLLVGGGNKADNNQTNVTGSSDQATYTPGNDTTQQYRQLVNQQNEDVAKQAEANNSSAIPIPTGKVKDEAAAKEKTLDPLDQFVKQQQQSPPPPPPPAAPPVDYAQPGAVAQPAAQPAEAAPAGPDPAVESMSKAMSDQMASLIQAWGPSQAQSITYTAPVAPATVVSSDTGLSGDLNSPGFGSGTDLAATPGVEEQKVRLLVPAGDVVYAQMFTEANSDVPAPILVSLVAGPLKGARLIGRFEVSNDYLYMTFNKLSMRGRVYGIDAVALDPNTTLAGMATEVDPRYFSRVILPAAADFVSKFGDAIANQNTTTTTVTTPEGNQVQTTNTGKIDTKQAINSGIGSAANRVSSFATNEASKIQQLVRVAAGTPLGILFLEPLTEPVKTDTSTKATPASTNNSNIIQTTKP